jgi:ribosomal protein L7/L12
MEEKLIGLVMEGIKAGWGDRIIEFANRILDKLENKNKNKDNEKFRFVAIMHSTGNKKISVIKELRSLVLLSLKEAKERVEKSVPVELVEDESLLLIRDVVRQLTEAGAVMSFDMRKSDGGAMSRKNPFQ